MVSFGAWLSAVMLTYLDKPQKAHTLMQAIARANWVYQGKGNGLIVDYCGILAALREALEPLRSGLMPAAAKKPWIPCGRPNASWQNWLKRSARCVPICRHAASTWTPSRVRKASLASKLAIEQAKEAINENDERRTRFELLAFAVARKHPVSASPCPNSPDTV